MCPLTDGRRFGTILPMDATNPFDDDQLDADWETYMGGFMSDQPVNPLPRVRDFIARYVALPDERQSLILGLWVMHTWTFSQVKAGDDDDRGRSYLDAASHTTPYIYVHSPEKQSGKTRLIEVLEHIVRNPMRATDMSPSVLFRAIETMAPTILLDEVDSIWSGSKNEDMRGTLNGGYKWGGHVWRTEQLEPRKFGTFCPKLLAGIDNGLLPDTIQDRCIPIVLRRKRKDQEVAPFFMWEIEEEVAAITDEISLWVDHHKPTLRRARPAVMDTISDRAWEITMPLVAIAELIGKDCGQQTREAVQALLTPTTQRTLSPGAQLLHDIREAFGEADRMFSAELVERLGSSWTQKLVSSRLRPYEIQSQTIRQGNTTGRGFYRKDFEDAWERYL